MSDLDFPMLADALVAWGRSGAASLRDLPSQLGRAIEAVLLERAHLRALQLTGDPSQQYRPNRSEFARSEVWSERRQQWYAEYYLRFWHRHLAGWVKDLEACLTPALRGGMLHSRLRQRLLQDVDDIARRSDRHYQYARQQLNAAIDKGEYPRTLDHRIAAVGRNPAKLPAVTEAQVGEIHAQLPVTDATGKAARAAFWLAHWFTVAPDHHVPLWRLTHEMLWAFEPLDAPDATATTPLLGVGLLAAEVLRNLERALGRAGRDAVLEQVRGQPSKALRDRDRDVLAEILRSTCTDRDEMAAVLAEIRRRMT